jgi:hypothetical protein
MKNKTSLLSTSFFASALLAASLSPAYADHNCGSAAIEAGMIPAAKGGAVVWVDVDLPFSNFFPPCTYTLGQPSPQYGQIMTAVTIPAPNTIPSGNLQNFCNSASYGLCLTQLKAAGYDIGIKN